MRRKPLSSGTLRTCMSVGWCAVCNLPIRMGERYHDAGATRRAHVACAKLTDKDPAEEKDRHEQRSAAERYWAESAKRVMGRRA